jgi:DNA-binding Lrp family transcriptional regulator
VDSVDRQILAELQFEGRLTVTELADRIRLSPGPCHRRLRELERTGVIGGYRAVVDPAALGLTIEAQIDVKLRPTTTAEAFERAIRDVPQVSIATLVTGSFDYALRVACSDRADLAAVTETIRERAGAQETYSRIILRELHLGRGAPKRAARRAKPTRRR